MSAKIVDRVLWTEMPPHLKLTAVILATHADEEGRAFPGRKRIAAMLGLGERAATKNITELERLGIVQRIVRWRPGGGRAPNIYQFDLSALGTKPEPEAKRNCSSLMENHKGTGAHGIGELEFPAKGNCGSPDSPVETPLETPERGADAPRARTAVSKAQPFTPPTVEEVAGYVCEKRLAVDAEYFVDFYASKGWMVGKSSMKDWQATLRNWGRREEKANPQPERPRAWR